MGSRKPEIAVHVRVELRVDGEAEGLPIQSSKVGFGGTGSVEARGVYGGVAVFLEDFEDCGGVFQVGCSYAFGSLEVVSGNLGFEWSGRKMYPLCQKS